MSRLTPAEARPPELKILPDGRKRLTHYTIVNTGFELNDALVQAWGALDAFPADAAHDTEDFADLRLVNQFTAEPGSIAGIDPKKLVWVEVYETLPESAELQVGSNTRLLLEDGRAAVQAEFLQFSTGTYAPGTVGTTTAPGDASAYLQKSEQTNDGTLRRITRTYVYAGTLSTDDESLQGGALLKKTIVSAKTVPTTPAGYTLVGSPVQSPNGLPVYTYTYYKGDGEVSRTWSASENANVNVDPDDPLSSPGIIRCVIRHLTAPSVTTNPITGPSSFILLDLASSQADGHVIWTATYVGGAPGTVSTKIDTSNNGALLITTIRSIHSIPSTPSGYTTIGTDYTAGDGVILYTYRFAKGTGEISRDIDYSQSSDQGTTGVTRTTIRYLVAPAATVQPTSLSGSVEISRNVSEADGHRIWTTVWAKGTGLVTSTNRLSNKGKLVVYRRTSLGTAPTAPTATIGGTVVSTDTGYREAEGFKVYDYEWAEGVGTVQDLKSLRNCGKLVVYRKVALGTAPSAPAATISGTVTLTADNSREESGVTIYDREWAEGVGIIREHIQERDGGLRLLGREILAAPGTTSVSAYAPAAGILLPLRWEELEGARLLSAVWVQKFDGTTPIAQTLAFERYVDFTYPGRAKVIYTTTTVAAITKTAYDLYRSPPVTAKVLATVKISYQTAATVGSLAQTHWNPTEWATLYPNYRAATTVAGGIPKSTPETLVGYRAISTTAVTFNGGSAAYVTETALGDPVFIASSGTPYSLKLEGGPAAPDGNTYTLGEPTVEPAFISDAGVQYYRRTVIEATIPSQPALPTLLP
jgi:hypothetical protein